MAKIGYYGYKSELARLGKVCATACKKPEIRSGIDNKRPEPYH